MLTVFVVALALPVTLIGGLTWLRHTTTKGKWQ